MWIMLWWAIAGTLAVILGAGLLLYATAISHQENRADHETTRAEVRGTRAVIHANTERIDRLDGKVDELGGKVDELGGKLDTVIEAVKPAPEYTVGRTAAQPMRPAESTPATFTRKSGRK